MTFGEKVSQLSDSVSEKTESPVEIDIKNLNPVAIVVGDLNTYHTNQDPLP